jgi:hypothetical protein
MAYNSRNYQTRRNPQCCDGWEHKMPNGQWMCGREHGICEGLYSPGGYLKGPKHEKGGIPAIIGGKTPIELEGNEYIINAQTTKALGTEFLDKLNSTATTYHQGGFQQGQLPGSKYARGGKVPNRRNKMRRGRKPARKMAHGGRAGTAMGRKPVRGTAKRRPTTISKSRGRVTRRATSPIRGRALGNTRAVGGKRPTRGTRVMERKRPTRGRQKYQTGGLTQNRQRYQNGGSLLNGFNPCPNHPDLNYTYFIEQPITIAGTSEFFCCQSAIRDENCTQFDDYSFLEDLVFAGTTNMAT